MKIFYFTSTGNCLEVSKRLNDDNISIPKALKGRDLHFEDDKIGIVVPNYQGDIPEPVKEFLSKATLKADYLFGIITYGMFNANANGNLQKYGDDNNVHFDYINNIIMVDNSTPYFNMDKQVKNLYKKEVDKHIDIIQKDILHNKKQIYNVNAWTKFTAWMISKFSKGEGSVKYHQNFYIEDKCTLCGICAKVCPLDNIIVDENVILNENCIRCSACSHNCPQNAIRYKGEKDKSRYRNKNVTLAEIIESNQ